MRTLINQEAPDASPVGIALAALSIVVMLWLARAKRRVATALGSGAMLMILVREGIEALRGEEEG